MVQSLRHRGPDDRGVNVIGNDPLTVFGHTRLSILDLSPMGHQPMHDPGTGDWITFNGEIYNFGELRTELEHAGETFRSHTDTEVLLKAYKQWGADCVTRLRGMFAFALWDAREHSLLLARDRLGIKPFYVAEDREKLIFASEVRAILASGLVERRQNPQGLCSYLAYGSVQEPYTLIQGISSLRPGHMMIVARNRTEVRPYWMPDLTAGFTGGNGELQDTVSERVADAVKSRMMADVPLGAFLSGGIDSTAVVGAMQKASNVPVRTFSVVFDDASTDERTFSRLAAKRIGTCHTELELTGSEVRANLPTALRAFDLPSVDGLNTWFVSKATKEAGLTVALSGVGGDEVFAGYGGFARSLQMERWSPWLRHIPPWAGDILEKSGRSERWRKLGAAVSFSEHPYFLSRRLFSDTQIRELLSSEMVVQSESWFPAWYRELAGGTLSLDSINRTSWLEMNTYMLSTLLRDTDQMSMAHALEVRVPLIDHLLVEFMLTVPGPRKLDRRTPKPLLVAAAQGMIPEECIYRPKQGFTLPFAKWLMAEMRDAMESFCNAGDSSILRGQTKSAMWQAFQKGRLSWSRIWALFVLHRWLMDHRVS